MSLQAIEAASSGTKLPGTTPFVGGQLPSPWNTPVGLQVSPSVPDSFAQALEQARGAAAAPSPSMLGRSIGVEPGMSAVNVDSVSKKMGFSALETMGNRLSQADAKMYRSVESLTNLDITSPNIHAEFLSVGLMSAKASISTAVAMKFSSKINESINTLLKTS